LQALLQAAREVLARRCVDARNPNVVDAITPAISTSKVVTTPPTSARLRRANFFIW
jgi:hypothetical protein